MAGCSRAGEGRPGGRGRAALAALVVGLVATRALAVVTTNRGLAATGPASVPAAHPAVDTAADGLYFATSHECLACHNGLVTPSGQDVSIGTSWRASMMAHSARDPYWQASVRREILDHPRAASEIEDECAVCHMPMARTLARRGGRLGSVFAALLAPGGSAEARVALDGVSCTVCHQIEPAGFGTRASFTGGYVIGGGAPRAFGPFPVDAGRATIMRSATGFTPTESLHVQRSELCATCHTLYTEALGPEGTVIGELPEQMPYLEWRHSAFREERSCQTCHMPEVAEPTPMSSVLGEPRAALRRHTFAGGNAFMLELLARFRTQLGVEAQPTELREAARATLDQLQSATASVAVARAQRVGEALAVDVAVQNLAGHKLPTGYPARRVWIHLVVRDRHGRVLFESGAATPDGRITGHDSDADPSRYEPHYSEIRSPEQVQVYEAVMADAAGKPTTGLLSAVRFVKDNRLLPRGFDKATAPADVAVCGDALTDPDFGAGGDRLRYIVQVGGAEGPLRVDVALNYQSIAYRWADNLRQYRAPEPDRFWEMYAAMADRSVATLARAAAEIP